MGPIQKAALILAAAVFTLAGCLSAGKFKPAAAPEVTVTTPEGATVRQTGDAQTPAKVTTQTQAHTVTLPAGSSFVFDEKLGTVTVHLSRDTSMRSEAHTTTVDAPRAFTPPAPPSPGEIADAGNRRLFWVGLVVGMAAAVFGLVRDYSFVMLGGAAVAAGCAFALFVQAHPLVFVLIGLGVTLKVVGPVLWHTKLKPAATP